MDGKAKKPKFPSFDYVPPPVESEDGEESKTSSTTAAQVVLPVEEQNAAELLPWPKDAGSLAAQVLLSVNGGATFKSLNLDFVAYKASMSSLSCSNDIVMSTGGGEMDIGLVGRNVVTTESDKVEVVGAVATADEEGNPIADFEADTDPEAAEVEAAETETAANGEDWNGPGLKAPVVEAPSNWLFSSTEIKVKFKGSAADGVTSIDSIVGGTYIEETNSITFNAPIMQSAVEWVEWLKAERLIDGVEEEDEEEAVEGEEQEAKPPTPPCPSILSVDVMLAMDGSTFEKVSTITMMPPPTISAIETEEGGAISGSQVRIIGSGFGDAGRTLRIEVSHVASGNDFSCKGIVEDGVGPTSESTETQSVVFNAPMDVPLESGQDVLDYQCIAEVSVDNQTLSDWRMTFAMKSAPEE